MAQASEGAVREALRAQARSSAARGERFTARLSQTLGRVLDRESKVGAPPRLGSGPLGQHSIVAGGSMVPAKERP